MIMGIESNIIIPVHVLIKNTIVTILTIVKILDKIIGITEVNNSKMDSVSLVIRATTFPAGKLDRKSTRLNSSHVSISYAVFCLKNKRFKCLVSRNSDQYI